MAGLRIFITHGKGIDVQFSIFCFCFFVFKKNTDSVIDKLVHFVYEFQNINSELGCTALLRAVNLIDLLSMFSFNDVFFTDAIQNYFAEN